MSLSDHEIVWTHDIDQVVARVVCHAEPEAKCRWVSDCDCEVYHSMGRDEEGRPYHLAYEGVPGVGLLVGEGHMMREGGECQYALWLNEDGPVEFGPTEPFEIARTQISVVWEDDYYEWRRA